MLGTTHRSQKAHFQQDIRSYPSLALPDLTRILYEESCHTSYEVHHPAYGTVPDEIRHQDINTIGEAVVLPVALTKSYSLQESMRQRVSTRFFTSEPLKLVHLATLLQSAQDGDQHDWSQEKETGVFLQFTVVAWRVENCPPAVYCYESHSHALVPIHTIPDQTTEAKNLVLQVEFADAPVIILITGNLAAASARYGAWGHRQLLIRAGTAGQRLWFASLGLGLAGTVFAGFLQPAAYTYANIDGYRSAGLLAYTTGYAYPDRRA